MKYKSHDRYKQSIEQRSVTVGITDRGYTNMKYTTTETGKTIQ
jgi:hypothetical protein